MTSPQYDPNRRRLVLGLGALTLSCALPVRAAAGAPHLRAIPADGQRIPAIGMGTWITFDVHEPAERESRVEVLRAFFDHGGALVDSSPMYGYAQSVVGHCLEELQNDSGLVSATKVWIPGRERGIAQMEGALSLWGLKRFDLMQVHNMLDWRTHLPTLREWKEDGRIRYIGITTSHGRRHSDLEAVIRNETAFDAAQFSYSIADRDAEARLLPLAADHGKAVIINRPFRTGQLFRHVQGRSLPGWAGEIGCDNWAQFFLKFVISHPAVTCVIPATSRVDHMLENMGALRGPLPDAAFRKRMAGYFDTL